MKCVVGNQAASSRTPEGPIAPHMAYSRNSSVPRVMRRARFIARFFLPRALAAGLSRRGSNYTALLPII
jgi:hypothetical protein